MTRSDLKLFYLRNHLVRAVGKGGFLLARTGATALTSTTHGAPDSLLLQVDDTHSVLGSLSRAGLAARFYNAYGYSMPEEATTSLGFKGHLLDIVSATYLLGRRHFNPALQRFGSSDILSPFGPGSINSYAYPEPINHDDPSGMVPKWIRRIGNTARTRSGPRRDADIPMQRLGTIQLPQEIIEKIGVHLTSVEDLSSFGQTSVRNQTVADGEAMERLARWITDAPDELSAYPIARTYSRHFPSVSQITGGVEVLEGAMRRAYERTLQPGPLHPLGSLEFTRSGELWMRQMQRHLDNAQSQRRKALLRGTLLGVPLAAAITVGLYAMIEKIRR